ncbi:MAG: hypothetical protein R3E68_09060 [Burkholderiaceae bacterium]
MIALAAQGIDDNADTQPIDIAENGQMSLVSTSLNNHDRLLSYHFVLTEPVLSPSPPSLSFRTPTSTDVSNPASPQLDRLMAAVGGAADPCAQAHLLGEYVHAFQDTFSHRNADNEPYSPFWHVPFRLGMGHAMDMHDPDWTFNHTNRAPEVSEFGEQYANGAAGVPDTPDGRTRIRYEDWSVNEARTLQMERELHALLTRYGDPSKAVPFSEIEAMLTRFNATPEWHREGVGDGESFPRKLRGLTNELDRLGSQLAEILFDSPAERLIRIPVIRSQTRFKIVRERYVDRQSFKESFRRGAHASVKVNEMPSCKSCSRGIRVFSFIFVLGTSIMPSPRMIAIRLNGFISIRSLFLVRLTCQGITVCSRT